MLSLTPQRVRPSAHGAKQMFGVEPCAALVRAMPARRDLAQLGRGTSLAQVISSDVSDASAIPHKTDDLDAGGPIFHGRMRLRALWTVWSVEVRVFSGASEKAPHGGAFSCSAATRREFAASTTRLSASGLRPATGSSGSSRLTRRIPDAHGIRAGACRKHGGGATSHRVRALGRVPTEVESGNPRRAPLADLERRRWPCT